MYIAYNPKKGQRLKTDARGVFADRAFLAHYQVSAAAAVAASNTAVHEAVTLADGATTEVITAITSPAIPRALRIKGSVAGITGNVVIEGTDYNGDAISETIAANGANAVEGNKAFRTVTKITVPARNAEGNTISIGFNDKLGLPYKLAHDTVIAAYLDNILESSAPTVVTSASALSSNTIDLTSALAGKVVDVYLIV